MNTCSTCGTHTNTTGLGIQDTYPSPTRRPGEKLEFVEHVLGVLIESRYGNGDPYERLGDRPLTTGHSQIFAIARLLSAAEIEVHLELPLALANGPLQRDRTGFRPKVAWAKAREIVEALIRRLKPTATRGDRTGGSSLPRGSPTSLGRIFLRGSFATSASFA